MNAFFVAVLTNAVIATGMFVILFACRSRIRNPAVLHLLWLLVLAKLLTPPIWSPQLALLPATESAASIPQETTTVRYEQPSLVSSPQPSVETLSLETVPPERASERSTSELVSHQAPVSVASRRLDRPAVPFLLFVAAIWGAGSLSWWGLAVGRIIRFQRCLRFVRVAPLEFQQTAQMLALQLGLRRCPLVSFVPGRVSPMLWAFPGPARVIVPSELVSRFDKPSCEALLLHELVHYRRGDHWVRWLEIVSLGLYWWNPMVWILRREILRAEESACDAWVVSHRPGERRTYAETIVSTLAFLSSTGVPALATGVGRSSNLEDRLKMIMRTQIDPRVSGRNRLLVSVLALLLLPLAPVLVRGQQVGSTKTETVQETAAKQATLDGEATGTEQRTERGEELKGAVVNEDGKPVAGIQVTAYLRGRRLDRDFKTNEKGEFRVPREWRPDARKDDHAVLIVREGEAKLGWLDLRSSVARGSKDGASPPSTDSFRIVLLPRTQMVKGTLVDPKGMPLGGILVRVEWMMHETNSSISQYAIGENDIASAMTDGQGIFAISLPSGAKAGLQPRHSDWQRKRIAIKPPNVEDLGRIVLPPAARIEGRVVDAATGKPLANQRVFAQSQSSGHAAEGFVSYGDALTDQDGRYILGGLSPGRFNVLFDGQVPENARQPTLTAVAVEGVDVEVGQPAEANFQASTGRRLSGKVLDCETGKPLPKISVGYYGSARPHSGAACMMVTTDADGAYEFRVPPGVSKVYVADGRRQPHEDSSRTLEVPVDKDLTDVVLQAGKQNTGGLFATEVDAAAPAGPKGYELHVKLQTPPGQKLNKVDARTARRGSRHTSQWTALSETGFRVQYHSSQEGRATILLIDANGFAPARSAEFVVREQMPELVVELSPEVLVPVRGKVVDTEGKGVAGARVRVARHLFGEEQAFPWGLEYKSGDDGRFEIKHARVGDRIRVRVDKSGTGGAESDWITLDRKGPRIIPHLRIGPPNEEMGGLVRDFEGFPVANAKVSILSEAKIETTTDAEGKFHLTGVPAGDVNLVIDSKGFPPDVRPARAGKMDNELAVPRISEKDRRDYKVSVTLRPSDGKEMTRVTLFFSVENGALLTWIPDRQGNSFEVEFAPFVRRHSGKEFSLAVAADGYAQPKPVTVPNQRRPEPIEINLEPAAPVKLCGRVVDEQGHPVAEAKVGLSVSLNDRATNEPWRYWDSRENLPLTRADGTFEVGAILPGSRVAVYVNKPGYAGVWSERVAVGAADIDLPQLRLSQATGELAGRVVDQQGDPVADAVVALHDLTSIETITDANGRFRLPGIPDRKMLLRVRAEAGEWAKEVAPNDGDLEVKLRSGR